MDPTEFVRFHESKIKRYYHLTGMIDIYVKDPISKNIDLNLVLRKLRTLPSYFFDGINRIVIGDFKFLKRGNFKAKFVKNIICIDSEQKDEEDLYLNIIHELGHAIEEMHPEDIYGDGEIEEEFLKKKGYILDRIKYAFQKEIADEEYSNVRYSKSFDDFLRLKIGYDSLYQVSHDLFISPYAVTDVREYFATGFEAYCGGEKNLDKISPILYSKIKSLFRI